MHQFHYRPQGFHLHLIASFIFCYLSPSSTKLDFTGQSRLVLSSRKIVKVLQDSSLVSMRKAIAENNVTLERFYRRTRVQDIKPLYVRIVKIIITNGCYSLPGYYITTSCIIIISVVCTYSICYFCDNYIYIYVCV